MTAPVAPVAGLLPLHSAGLPSPPPAANTGGFGDLLLAGLRQVDSKVARADAMLQAFAAGEAIPVHQLTLSLEQARLAVELAAQIRTRLVETYRDFMTMQV